MHDQNIANVGVFNEWLADECLYLLNLQRELLQETLIMEYWQKLVNLGASEYGFPLTSIWSAITLGAPSHEVVATEQAWRILTPTTSPDHIDSTSMAETKQQHAQEQVQKDLLAVQGLEMKLGIVRRWTLDNEEWKSASTLVGHCRYQCCLDNLEGLIVSRMFELAKMNIAGTGE